MPHLHAWYNCTFINADSQGIHLDLLVLHLSGMVMTNIFSDAFK